MKNIIKSKKGFRFNAAGVEIKAGRTILAGRPYVKASVSDNTVTLAAAGATIYAGAKLVVWTGKTAATLAKSVKAHFTGKPAAQEEEDFMEQ